MECIKKLHETVEILETLRANCLNCLKNLMHIFMAYPERISHIWLMKLLLIVIDSLTIALGITYAQALQP